MSNIDMENLIARCRSDGPRSDQDLQLPLRNNCPEDIDKNLKFKYGSGNQYITENEDLISQLPIDDDSVSDF